MTFRGQIVQLDLKLNPKTGQITTTTTTLPPTLGSGTLASHTSTKISHFRPKWVYKYFIWYSKSLYYLQKHFKDLIFHIWEIFFEKNYIFPFKYSNFVMLAPAVLAQPVDLEVVSVSQWVSEWFSESLSPLQIFYVQSTKLVMVIAWFTQCTVHVYTQPK